MLNAPTLPTRRLANPTQIGDAGMVNQTMAAPNFDPAIPGGGGGMTPIPSTPVQAPTQSATGITPPTGPMPSVPAGGIPSAPVQPPSMAPTDANPLAPLNNYQAQQRTGNYQAPAF